MRYHGSNMNCVCLSEVGNNGFTGVNTGMCQSDEKVLSYLAVSMTAVSKVSWFPIIADCTMCLQGMTYPRVAIERGVKYAVDPFSEVDLF